MTVVPALIPTFLKGHLRSEEENWIVRSFIHIYRPLLTWALPRRNLVMWAFAVLLVLAAGMFPLQALIGQGTSEIAWRATYLGVFALVTSLTVLLTRGWYWQALSLASLLLIGLWAYHFPKIGVAFMPALDEGTLLDMPITVPRASVTQSADDLKARDALLRGFPEVESVIGKAGRADTPTDPAPLDMVETFVNFRPKELWPKRVIRYPDAAKQTARVLATLEERGFVSISKTHDDRETLINDAAQKAIERFDETMRELALLRYSEFERELGPRLVQFVIEDCMRKWQANGSLPISTDPASVVQRLMATDGESSIEIKSVGGGSGDAAASVATRHLTTDAGSVGKELAAHYGYWLSESPALEDVTALVRDIARRLEETGDLSDLVVAMELKETSFAALWQSTKESMGSPRRSFADAVLQAVTDERMRLWRERVHSLNWELADYGSEAFLQLALEETVRVAGNGGLLAKAPRAAESEAFAAASLRSQLPHRPRVGGADPLPHRPRVGGEMPYGYRGASDSETQGDAKNDGGSKLGSDKAFNHRHGVGGEGGSDHRHGVFIELRDDLLPAFRKDLFLWPRKTGPKGDLVDDEMSRVLQVPGWSNIFTQPIINRIEMLSTGVRTDIGVKVFGPQVSVRPANNQSFARDRACTRGRDRCPAPQPFDRRSGGRGRQGQALRGRDDRRASDADSGCARRRCARTDGAIPCVGRTDHRRFRRARWDLDQPRPPFRGRPDPHGGFGDDESRPRHCAARNDAPGGAGNPRTAQDREAPSCR